MKPNHLNQSDYNKLKRLADYDFLSEIFNLVDINYTLIAKDGTYVFQNQSTFKQISQGLLKAQEIDVDTWNDCLQVMEKGEKVIKEEFFRGRFFLSVKKPLIENNVCLGILVISVDITKQKQAEQAKKEFIRNMSHDFRTPLFGIKGMAEILFNLEENIEKKNYLNDILISSNQLNSFLDEIVELISSENSIPIKFEKFKIEELIEKNVDLISAVASLKNIIIKTCYPEKIICTDLFRFQRILANLISNAIKFTLSGEVKITVETEPTLQVIIEDTGIGIPKEQIDYIFQKFTKLSPSNIQAEYQGSGLGLYIARNFAREIGGDILVESKVGVGSKFTFIQNLSDCR